MFRSALMVAAAAALALGGFTAQPAVAAQSPVIAATSKQQAQDFSAVRKKRRHHGRGFGANAATSPGNAAAERRREYQATPYGYSPPGLVADPPAGPPAYLYAPPAVGHHR